LRNEQSYKYENPFLSEDPLYSLTLCVREGATAIALHTLLVEPDYYTRYPPLGLLKLAALHRYQGGSVELIRGEKPPSRRPDRVYVTSLFTYAWKPVHRAVHYYRKLFPGVPISLGGIYAS